MVETSLDDSTDKLSDWDLLFKYEQSVIEYAKNYKYISEVEKYRKEITTRLGW